MKNQDLCRSEHRHHARAAEKFGEPVGGGGDPRNGPLASAFGTEFFNDGGAATVRKIRLRTEEKNRRDGLAFGDAIEKIFNG